MAQRNAARKGETHMKLTILGMNGPFPAAGGACSGYFVQHEDTCVQLDMGTGTLAALTRLTAPEKLTALVFSHWHFDHCSDVLPLLYRLSPTGPLAVYGPEDELSPVRAILASMPQVRLHTLHAGDTVQLGDISLTAFTARHPVPALMYRLTAGGRTLAYTGDTNTTDDLPALADHADLLLADGLFTEATWDAAKPHLSAAHVAKLAAEASAARVIITHLSPAIDPETLLKEARAHRIDALLAACGDTYQV